MKKLFAFIKKFFTKSVQGFIAGVAVAYPGLVEFLTSYFN